MKLLMIPNDTLTVFLTGDAAAAGKACQQTPSGDCMDARGLQEKELVEGCQSSKLDQLTELTARADKVLVF